MQNENTIQELTRMLTGIRDERAKGANTAWRVGSALLALLDYAMQDNGTYLSREHDDAAAGAITFLKGIVSESTAKMKGGTQFGSFTSGIMGGTGAQID